MSPDTKLAIGAGGAAIGKMEDDVLKADNHLMKAFRDFNKSLVFLATVEEGFFSVNKTMDTTAAALIQAAKTPTPPKAGAKNSNGVR